MQHSRNDVLHRMRVTGLVPVLRASSVAEGVALARAIAAGGVDVLEITMTIPGALEVIRTLVRDEPSLLIGAGTVLDPETARICMLEGAQFIVSPGTNVKTIEMCRRYACPVLPGALTPTEVIAAWEAGADMIKLFPASAMGGAKYLRSLKAPLPQINFVPTGGISLDTASDFLHAGAFALGVGADLADAKHIGAGTPEKITEIAKRYRQIVIDYQQHDAPAPYAPILPS
ncbi:MAG: bifunctional 4-hydroxy-2-oxoglutarate aldolase/2-dehydro-3-deoxy-phosphogluconate aldolase [Janthinobacterium lividum]